MFNLQIQIDEAAVREGLGDFARRAPQAMAGAINETTAEGKTDLSRAVREVLNLSKQSTDRRIEIVKARPNNLAGSVRLSHEKRPGLASFAARETKKGVSYKLTKSSGRASVPSAFIAAKRGQTHLNVFVRKLLGGKLAPRYPLVRLMGLSPWGAITYRAGVLERIQADAQEALHKNLNQRVSAIVGGYIPERRAA